MADSRLALALAAHNFFGPPTRKLRLAGVTGTSGKTTSAYALESILRAAGLEVGDRLLSVDGVEVTTFDEFGDLIEVRGGEQVEVRYERDGTTETLMRCEVK